MLCPKCQNAMGIEGENFPVVLGCTHDLCLKCLRVLSKEQIQQPEFQVECSVCNQSKAIDLAIWEKEAQTMKDMHIGPFICKKHPSNSIQLFCPKDKEFICCLCIPKHADHAG